MGLYIDKCIRKGLGPRLVVCTVAKIASGVQEGVAAGIARGYTKYSALVIQSPAHAQLGNTSVGPKPDQPDRLLRPCWRSCSQLKYCHFVTAPRPTPYIMYSIV